MGLEDFVKEALGKSPTVAVRGSGEFDEIKIKVIGVGGGGNNTVNRMKRLEVKGAGLIAVNTDRQHLNMLDEGIKKILIGRSVTKGLGAGGFPDIGMKCAEVDRSQLEEELAGTHLVFLCAGMGGGTGSGAAPVIAEVAKQQGAIVVAMVTYPFALERARVQKADEGIQRLREVADSVIILDNNRLVQIVPNLPMNQAFLVADEILAKAIGGLVFTITQPSLVNIDFADVRAIMGRGDVGFIAVGTGKGPAKVEDAVDGVLKNRLLDVDFTGAKGAIIHIAGGADLTLGDAIRAGEMVTEQMDPQASVKWGARLIPSYDGKIEITAIVTGVSSAQIVGKTAPRKQQQKSTAYDIEIVG
ncbi:cell division protein FtsZ [Candidatus Micrarchaeota archaeon CG_4_10_14_0_2_um_filter_60_11]|nr:MAG: cell division protein FtsZ [Candidatus Micrarchaeota archaeon CG1_02_60_51]PIN95919.1 MAG: cell division protein FtsZ [Candidatus Micrarchaeota archaeon CG10_big_fil_rev_8_21_14_0_10_60_32]PIO02119.1 MAG: cell division protein FtsZ [Candidatus Micrarchaeota archaeon CG09_land_8_20_14_0_10_60_16]PIZ90562.1 MAG: cell division protein FtsZ [Candidatus Micrarchaeota archaeon CG_4_10_14_0_2_um_filter_60_11]